VLSKNTVDQIFQILSDANPQPKTELKYTNNFTLLVAVVLSAQCTDVNVNKATDQLFKIIHCPNDILHLGEEKLKTHIKTIGLFNGKAKNIISLAKDLKEKFNSEVPNDFDDLISLSGVGRKTANVVLNCAFGKETIAVDTHVFRVSNRIGIVNQKDIFKTEEDLLKNIPTKWKFYAHHWLILHGRYVCKARKPNCSECTINQLCLFKKK
jgi:endonuclease-3